MKCVLNVINALSALLLLISLQLNDAQSPNLERELLNGENIAIEMFEEAGSFWLNAFQGSFSQQIPPQAIDDFDKTYVDVPINIEVLSNDKGDYDPSTTKKLTSPSNGSVTKNPDNTFQYTPNSGYTGTDTFIYEVCDIDGVVCSQARVTVDIIEPPKANNDNATTSPNIPVDIPVLINDTGDYDPNTTKKLTDPSNGSIVLNPDKTFTYTPNPGYVGVDTFTYEICGKVDSNVCTIATVTVTVTATPIANDDSDTTYVNTPVTVPVLTNDTGDYDPATMKKLTDPSNGSIVLNPDKTFTYTPNSGYVGVDTFTYEICNNDNSVCSTATVTVTIIEPPKANDDDASTSPGIPVSIPVLTNDTGDYDPATTKKVTDPANGSIVLNPDKTFTYTPNPGYVGVDTFTYEICGIDDSSVCSTATVTVTISPLPNANDDVDTTYVDVPVTIPVLTNDSGDYDPATTKKLTDPSNGSIVLNPAKTFTYTPNSGYVGDDTFTYEICNTSNTACSTATVTVSIIEPPKAIGDIEDTPINTPVVLPVLTNDTGDYDPATTKKLTDPANGSIVLNPDKTFTYTPNPGYVGVDTFTYEICGNDDSSVCSSATVIIYIEDAPSMSPTFFPSIVPSVQPSESKCCNMSPVTYDAYLTNVALSVSGTVLPGSPQEQALNWLKAEIDYCECDVNSCKISERYALAVFYFTAGGDSWLQCSMPDLSNQASIDAANAACTIGTTPTPGALDVGLLPSGTDAWLTPVDACQWAGIVCRISSECVDRLEFEENNVVGSLPAELNALLEMRFLILEKGGLSSSIPSEWGVLTQLLFVDFDFNQLTGSIPNYLYTFTNMLQFDVNDNQLTGTLSTEIGLLTDLVFLQMDENNFSGPLPSELGNLDNLRVGVFSFNDFTGEVSPALGDNIGLSVLESDCAGPEPKVICTVCTDCK